MSDGFKVNYAQTRAIDVPCPSCFARPRIPCAGGRFCQPRVNAAMKLSRLENIARRAAAKR